MGYMLASMIVIVIINRMLLLMVIRIRTVSSYDRVKDVLMFVAITVIRIISFNFISLQSYYCCYYLHSISYLLTHTSYIVAIMYQNTIKVFINLINLYYSMIVIYLNAIKWYFIIIYIVIKAKYFINLGFIRFNYVVLIVMPFIDTLVVTLMIITFIVISIRLIID
jgi:hypothetical protein